MTTLSSSDFILSQNRVTGEFTASDWDYNWGLVPQIFNGSPTAYDVAFGNVGVAGNVTASGNVTAVNYYGNGSNLTGISSGGSSAGVGISQVEMLTETSKQFRTKLPTSLTNIISEPLIDGANFTGTLTAQANSGATIITITPTVTGQEPPKLMSLILVKASDGTNEEVFITGGSSGTYTISAGLSQTYPISSPIYRNFCSLSTASANASILAGQNGNARYIQTHTGGQIDVKSRTNATIDWSARINSLTQGLQASSVVASPSNIINVLMATDRTGEFSSTSPYNKIILCKVTEDGQKNVYQIGNGKEFTITNVGAFSSTYAPITVSDTYNDMDTGNTAATGGVTAAGITALSSDGLTYWIVQAKTAIPKLSFVPTATNESFVEIIPKKATVFNQGIAYPSYIHSYWPLNESSASNAINVKQTSGLFNLTMVGTVTSTTGKIALARNGFAAGNYLKYSTGGVGTPYDATTFFCDGWFKTATSGSIQQICGKENNAVTQGWSVRLNASNYIEFVTDNGALAGAVSLSDNAWHYFAVSVINTSGSGNKRVYIDGSLVNSTTGVAFTPNAADFCVGGLYLSSSTVSYPFGGALDEVSFGNAPPASQADCDSIVALRYAGSRGRAFGSQFGMDISGTESNKTGQLATFRTDIVQPSLTATLATIESKNLIVSGGI